MLFRSLPVTGLKFGTKRVGTPIHLESECYQPLADSDSDENSFINSTEYITFVRALAYKMNYTEETIGDDARSNVFKLGDLESLPPFDEQYNSLRCSDWCQINGNEPSCEMNCSHGILGIPIYAKQALDGEIALLQLEQKYMYKVCADTLVAVKTFFEINPASHPSEASFEPHVAPTSHPSQAPFEPSVVPTSHPSQDPFPVTLVGIGAGTAGFALFSVGSLLVLKRRRRRSRMPIEDGDDESSKVRSSVSIESKLFDEELAEEDTKDWTKSILVASY